jgi:hypothetical protein
MQRVHGVMGFCFGVLFGMDAAIQHEAIDLE